MRPPIYKPKGAAGEYAEDGFALNIYDGCPHACAYCYVPNVLHKDRAQFHASVTPRPNIVEEVRKQLHKEPITGKTIFLCFTCDPFPSGYDHTPTLEIIKLLKEHGNHVQILTKGDGSDALDLLDENDWYGVTLDGSEDGNVAVSRLETLRLAKTKGINTWISFEPVLNNVRVISYIVLAKYYFVDRVKIGKLNYRQTDIDWKQFGIEAEAICQRIGLDYYIKDSLRKEMER